MSDLVQHYNNVGDLVEKHSLWLPKPKEWRLVKQPISGQINGLPHFRGAAVATNGIHVAIESSAGVIFIGHLLWFVKDKPEAKTDLFDNVVTKPKRVDIHEMDELFV